MDKPRIVFMGTPDFAVTILQSLVEHQYNVVGVVTVADKPAGRGRKLQSSPVKQYAEQQNIPILQPLKLKDTEFLQALKAWKADLQVVVAFRMLPKEVWQMPTLGTFNLHASLLPNYRGAAPINWAIINQEKESGVTTFMIDEKIDTGAILLQEKIDLEANETAGTLHDKLMHIGADLVRKTIDALVEKSIEPQPQPSSATLKDAPKLFKDTCRIDWSQSGGKVDAFIRGLNPYPAAWTELEYNEETLLTKIYKGNFVAGEHQKEVGNLLVNSKEMGVYIPNGIYYIEELKVSGKRRMHTQDFLNGVEIEKISRDCK